ncbi:MAG: AbiV family abortive infection protein [Thiobacillaceae bacterium]
MRKSEQYRGRLTSAEIAEGMNVARQNAVRLAKDARLLFENKRCASALALAILSIEEAGKEAVLRGLAVASDDRELIERWKDYRSHTKKNAHWTLLGMVSKGARRLDDFLPMFYPNAGHTELLDNLKQLCLYTDSFRKGVWSVPERVIPSNVVRALVHVAEILCQTRQITTEEIELWIQYMKPVWNSPVKRDKALIEFDKEMRRRGLIPAGSAMSMEDFVTKGLQPKWIKKSEKG